MPDSDKTQIPYNYNERKNKKSNSDIISNGSTVHPSDPPSKGNKVNRKRKKDIRKTIRKKVQTRSVY